MSHTKEPWSIDEYGRVKADGCNEFLGVQVDGFSLNGGQESKENARRIVACVNACAGASTEYLEGFAIGVNATGIPIDKVMELSNNERDQLRELCGDLLDEVKEFYSRASGRSNGVEMLITKAEPILGEKNGR